MPKPGSEKGGRTVPLTDRDYRRAQQLEITASRRKGGIEIGANKAMLEKIRQINQREDEKRTARTDD